MIKLISLVGEWSDEVKGSLFGYAKLEHQPGTRCVFKNILEGITFNDKVRRVKQEDLGNGHIMINFKVIGQDEFKAVLSDLYIFLKEEK